MEFFNSLKNFWGIVSAISASFPILNRVYEVLPLLQTPKYATLQTTLGSIVAIYSIALFYSQHRDFPRHPFVISGVNALLAILIVGTYLYFIGIGEPFDPARNTIIILLSTAFSFCMTSSFSVLAVYDFVSRNSDDSSNP